MAPPSSAIETSKTTASLAGAGNCGTAARRLPNVWVLSITVGLSVLIGLIAVRDRVRQNRIIANVQFLEQSQALGISFQHHKPEYDPKLTNIMPWLASVGASVAVADYDRSGHMSVFLTNSSFGSENALFYNEGVVGGEPRFRNVTDISGLSGLNNECITMAAAWGDYDNDGFPDLYVMRSGRKGNLLFHNVPALDQSGKPIVSASGIPVRKFVDVTRESGTGYIGYSVGAVWFDYDRDGLLDLIVANYFSAFYPSRIATDPEAADGKQRLDLWHVKDTRFMPDSFNNARNGGGISVYHNDGHGHFSEVHQSLGMVHSGFALALGAGDLNNDGWPDLYVANDFGPDDYYVNVASADGGRKFVRVEGGFTADKVGRDTKKGMNVDIGDVDHSGKLGIYVTNITNKRVLPEGNLLWIGHVDASKVGGWNFDDHAVSLGVNDCGWSWGAKFADVNNDGWNDLFVANGFISASRKKDYWYELENMASDYRTILEDAARWPTIGDKSLSGYQRSCLFVREGGKFVDMAEAAGITDLLDGRGVATADLANSGTIDFVVSNQDAPALVYRNQLYAVCKAAECPHWIGFRLEGNGVTSNRDAIGARVTLGTEAGQQIAEVARGNGFASQSDPRLHFGLGHAAGLKSVSITWPDGRHQSLTTWKLDAYNDIIESDQIH